MFDDYGEERRTRSSPYGTFQIDSITLELPFKCPVCGAYIREDDADRLVGFKGYAKDKTYIEHLGPGCVFEPKQIRVFDVPPPPGQVTLNDTDEGGEAD